jgi:hypothetical protein
MLGLMSYGDVVKFLGLSKRTIGRMVAAGELEPPVVAPSGKRRHFRTENILRYYFSCRPEAPAAPPPPDPPSPPAPGAPPALPANPRPGNSNRRRKKEPPAATDAASEQQ